MILVEIAGFLGADPEERFTSSGKRVVGLRVATRVRHSGQDETVWWRVSIWGDRFDRMLPFLKKGSAVIVVGDMNKPETYVGKDGQTNISMSLNAEMIKFSPFGKPDKGEESSTSSDRAPLASVGNSSSNASDVAPDDLPF